MPTREAIISTTALIRSLPSAGVNSAVAGSEQVVHLGQTLDIQENVNRIPIAGIGDFGLRDVPAVRWSGMISIDVTAFSFITHPTGGVIRSFKDTKDFQKWHTYFGETVSIELWDRYLPDGTASTAVINATVQEYLVAKITDARWVDDGFSLPDQSVATRRTSFMYLEPVISRNIEDMRADPSSTVQGDEGDAAARTTARGA